MSSRAATHGLSSNHDVQMTCRRPYSEPIPSSYAIKLLTHALTKNSLNRFVLHQLHVLAICNPEVNSFLKMYLEDHPACKYMFHDSTIANKKYLACGIPLYTKHTQFEDTYNQDRNIYMNESELKASLAMHINLKNLASHVVDNEKKMKSMSSFTLAALLSEMPETWDKVFPHVKQSSYGFLTSRMKDFHTKLDLSTVSKSAITDMVYERPSIAWSKDFPVEKINQYYVWNSLFNANPDKAYDAYIKRLESGESVSKTEFRTVTKSNGKFVITAEIAHICPLSAKELILHAGRNDKRVILEDGLAEVLEADLLSEFLFGTESNSTILRNKLKQVKGDVEEEVSK